MEEPTPSARYGLIARLFHWSMALIVIGLLGVGFYMAGLDFSPFKLQLYGLHKSFGLLILGLVALRILWRLVRPPPGSLPTHAAWEKAVAKLTHFLLYAGMIGMPLTGWIMSSAGDFPIPFFGLFEVPDVTAKNEALFRLTRELHEVFGICLLGAILLHFAGAVKHHLIDRDETLRRMGGNMAMAVLGAALLVGPVYFVSHELLKEFRGKAAEGEQAVLEDQAKNSKAPVEAAQDVWVIDHDQSAIKFQATQYGQSFEGQFGRFDGTIIFDPENLDGARADIEIDIASIKTGSEDRDIQAKGSDWFNVAEFPKAHFKAGRFEAKGQDESGANRYTAYGDLTIRGATIQVELPFTLSISQNEEGKSRARMEGQMTLQRLDFGIGQGQWESTEAIGNNVVLSVEIKVQRF